MKIIQPNSRKSIASAVKKYAEMIVPTYGPAGKQVLIATNQFSLKAADDGHAASVEVELENEFENAVVMYMREATEKTNSRVGDGTTTSVILTKAIIDQVMTDDQNDPFNAKTNYLKEVREIQKASQEAVEYIKNKSTKVETSEELYAVAYNSYNNETVARLIAETLFKIGRDGVLVIEDSRSSTTEVELVEGVEIEKGYASPYLINTDKETVVMNAPSFLLVEERLERFADVVPLLKEVFSKTKDIVIVADSFGEDFLANTIMNKIRGTFSPLLIEAPGFGEGKSESLKNLAAVVGATIFDGKTKKLSSATLADLGTAQKIVSKKDKTVIVGGNEVTIAKRIVVLQGQLAETTQVFNRERLEKTIASLTGGIALIKVGANTENEQKSVKMKVEDAVNATKVAFKDGVVTGAGKTFSEIETSSVLFNAALKAPRKQLEENGKEFLDENVSDPAGVLVAAIETASSIACGLLSMGGIIVTKRKEEKE